MVAQSFHTARVRETFKPRKDGYTPFLYHPITLLSSVIPSIDKTTTQNDTGLVRGENRYVQTTTIVSTYRYGTYWYIGKVFGQKR